MPYGETNKLTKCSHLKGNFYRKFDEDEDRSHHGKAYNPHFSEVGLTAAPRLNSCNIDSPSVSATGP